MTATTSRHSRSRSAEEDSVATRAPLSSGAGTSRSGGGSGADDHVGGRGSEAEVLRTTGRDHVDEHGSEAEVLRAIASVCDPEYPGVSIVDLGLLEHVEVRGGVAGVGLIPTFSGCPALAMIKDDVATAVLAVEGISEASVNWLTSPAWTPARLSARGRTALATEFTVAVQIGSSTPTCPLCGGPTVEHSMFGPSRCRAVHRCEACRETVEVMRG